MTPILELLDNFKITFKIHLRLQGEVDNLQYQIGKSSREMRNTTKKLQKKSDGHSRSQKHSKRCRMTYKSFL